MPQFEHVVRQVLKGAQAITATHDNGIDMELALSTLTERSQMSEVFGEGMTFAIRCLMCVQGGPTCATPSPMDTPAPKSVTVLLACTPGGSCCD
jgi:hypothetical protein